MQGQKNRFKLRIRFYDDNPENPAFLEIKRRETDVIKKKRAAITREGAKAMLAGEPPSPEFLYGNKVTAKSMEAMFEFCSLRDRIRAGGLHVRLLPSGSLRLPEQQSGEGHI